MALRRVGITLVGLTLLTAVAACAEDPEKPAPPEVVGECPATVLPSPAEVADTDGQLSIADMDPTGRFLVGTFVPATAPAADAPQTPVFRWDGDTAKLLPIANGRATGVNAHGVVVGTGSQLVGDQTVSVAWAYHESFNYLVLPVPDGYAGAAANAISDKGEIVGVALKDGAPAAVVVWRLTSTGYGVTVLEESPDVQANDITDDGTVVGQENHRPYAWAPDGTARALQIPAGLGTGAAVHARGAWAVGYINADVSMVIRWNLRNGELVVAGEYPQGKEFMTVSAIGNVAFFTGDGSVVDKYGDRYSLPVLPETPAGATGGPVAITDNGMVLAGQYADGGPAVLWRCGTAAGVTPSAAG